MKKVFNTSLAMFLSLIMVFSFTACFGNEVPDKVGIWSEALFTEDTQLGTGKKVLTVEVEAEEKVVVFTIKTNKKTVGDALQELQLIDGEEGEYGLYVKKVNGMTADYNVNQSYWAFFINGEYASTGVDGTAITEGETYRLTYTK